jgi:hypothetical protein
LSHNSVRGTAHSLHDCIHDTSIRQGRHGYVEI